ncbi:MAG: CCA tRNA nucleotidyltransferase [Bacillus sp. (in: firmicutes)]
MRPVFKQATPILTEIEKAGFEAYFVGGCVRDHLIGREISDIDIATSATPHEIKEIFPKTIDVGIEHGTVIVNWNKETYELTTFRTDGEYTDFRRPSEVTFIRNLHEDLKRRDFTMNSIAMDKDGTLIDPFQGKQAIQNKMIETVGTASERFHEDALRMMRAVRFVSQLQFSIEPTTYHALKEHASLLEKVATERKTIEFEKMLNGKNKVQALEMLIDTKLYRYLPGLMNHEKALLDVTRLDIELLTIVEIWSLLLYFIGCSTSESEKFLRQWKLPLKRIRNIQSILQLFKSRLHREWSTNTLFSAKLENAISTEKLFNVLNNKHVLTGVRELKGQFDDLIIKDSHELAVSGKDLMQWENKKGGPWLKEALQAIEKAVLTKQVVNEKEKIREWLQKCNPK